MGTNSGRPNLHRTAQFEACEPRMMMWAAGDVNADYFFSQYAIPLARSTVSMNDVGTIEYTKSVSNKIDVVAERDFFRFIPQHSGKVELTIEGDSQLKPELRQYDAVGISRSAASDQLTFNVVRGESTVVSVRALEGLGKYDLNFRWSPRAVDLQAVEAEILRKQDVDGDRWYRLRAAHDTKLRVESWIDPISQNIDVELYDAEFERIAAGKGRIKDDLRAPVEAGKVYFVRVAGDNSDVKIRLTNRAAEIADPVMLGSGKLVNYVGIGNADVTPDNPRGINRHNIPGDDWTAFYAERCEPLAAMGLRRWAIWMPFGRDANRMQTFENNGIEFQLETNLRIEQHSLARATGLYDKLCDSFVAATKAFLDADQEREVIAYLGTIIGAPEWTPDGSTGIASPFSVSSLRARLDAELAPYLEAGCSLAFDATALLPKNHWFYEYMQELKASGVRCYIESWAYTSTTHLATENGIILTEHLANYTNESIGPTPTINPPDGFNGFFDPQKITGERQVWLVNQMPGEPSRAAEWYREVIPTLLNNPTIDSVGFYVDSFVADGGKLSELDASLLPHVA